MKNYIVLLAVMLGLAVSSCKNEGNITPSGYKYEIIEDVEGESPNPTDWCYYSVKLVGEDGTVFQEIAAGPQMPGLQIPEESASNQFPNPVVDILRTCSVGDSFMIHLPLDSLQRTTPEMEKNKSLKYLVKLIDVKSDQQVQKEKEELRKETERRAAELKLQEPEVASQIAKTLKDYKAGKAKTIVQDRVEVIVHEEGEGKALENGSKATMQYYGVLKSNGEEFDNSFKRGRPFSFTVGRGEVISGWDKGLVGLKKGAKATIVIPFDMAYGAADRPGIPGKSDLVFYVEVEDVN